MIGVWWDTNLFIAKPNVTPFTAATTNWEILKWTSTIFDPLGFITPVIISTKLFLREL